MTYNRAWFREELDRGASFEELATASLSRPVARTSSSSVLAAVRVAAGNALGVTSSSIHVVGSARYGFSLRDGTPFDSAFSDLDLAVVDSDLYERCAAGSKSPHGEARFPEIGLPPTERRVIRERFDSISRSVSRQFLYVSAAVFPTYEALISAQADRIRSYVEGNENEGIGGNAGRSASPPCELLFSDALARGMPRYLEPIERSTPSNSSPWIVGPEGFASAFGGTPARAARVRALERALMKLSKVANVECCLVGGSFIDPGEMEPHDLDLVAFYSAHRHTKFELGRALQRLSRSFLLDKIDMRFVPVDASPQAVVKLTVFFTTLYQSHRSPISGVERGLVLLLPESSATPYSPGSR